MMTFGLSQIVGRGTSRGLKALLLAFVFTAGASPADAWNPLGRGEEDSYALINKIPGGHGPLTNAELAVILLADPPVASVSGFSLSVGYDPSRYTFAPSMSGVLCGFAVGGSCAPPSAVYGSYLISDLPILDFTAGAPLPGAVLTMTDDTVAGIVTVSYSLPTPLDFTTSGDTNLFAFYFEAKSPYNPYATYATFYDKPGTYDFTQLGASCISTLPCGSDTPVYGIDIRSVPEPSTWAMLGIGFAALVGVQRLNRRLRSTRV